ncbi:endonuclease [Bacteroidia bacterium]|nr:endonuclease [Bacteroidia bacterium]
MLYSCGIQRRDTQTANEPIRKFEYPAKLKDRKEQLIEHLGFTVSYNEDWKIPNWVAYELTKEEVEGVTPRGKHFIPDLAVKGATATTDDYKHTGWDRGHMAPAADMKWSEQAMRESFYLSNICPQNHNLNGGDWKTLEERVRAWATAKGSVYVVCGPIVSKQPPTIGQNKVAIPNAFFKVLLRNENGNWTAVAFLFANKSGHKPLSTYMLTVQEIQAKADIDFFPALPDKIEQRIESQLDTATWAI